MRIPTSQFEGIALRAVTTDTFDLDPLLEPTLTFWNALEIHCVSECCGLEAFDFYPHTIRKVAKDFDGIFDRLEALRNAIASKAEQTADSNRLNDRIHRDTLLDLIDHIANAIAPK